MPHARHTTAPIASVTVSRRAFTGATAVGAAAIAAQLVSPAGTAAQAIAEGASEETTDAGWLGEEPETPTEFSAEYDVDVVVVGLGHAGVAATRAAAEAGASVLAIEKGTDYGLGSKDCCAIGSKLFEERFPEIERYWKGAQSLLMNEISKGCLYRNDARILRKWMQINGENVDWYVSATPEESTSYGTSENGNAVDSKADYTLIAGGWPIPADYNPSAENMPCLPGSFKMGGGVNKGFLACNLDRAADAAGDRLTVLRDTRAIKLVREDGRIVGVIAQSADGGYVKANAASGVVLATGDFMNDEAMLAKFLPNVLSGGYVPNGDENWYMAKDADGNSTNTGDGHRMAVWAGARMQDYGCSMSHLTSNACSPFGTVPFLLLDRNGRRFMNEDVQGQQYAERVRQLPGRVAYQVYDASCFDEMPAMPYGHGKNPNATQEALAERVKDGSTVKADTLQELFAQIDIDADAAARSVARYNELCAEGADEDFGKTATRMFAVETAPFYASRVKRGDDLVTMSGIVCDELCRAVDANEDPIPGLYVAGNVQGGRFAVIYPESALGVSVAMALSFGREAGSNAAAGI